MIDLLCLGLLVIMVPMVGLSLHLRKNYASVKEPSAWFLITITYLVGVATCAAGLTAIYALVLRDIANAVKGL